MLEIKIYFQENIASTLIPVGRGYRGLDTASNVRAPSGTGTGAHWAAWLIHLRLIPVPLGGKEYVQEGQLL